MEGNDGVRLCASFSYVTNSLEYCGPKSSTKDIYNFLSGDDSLNETIRSALLKFEGLMPYFSVMAEKSGLDPFSKEITEAYWIGNSLLDTFSKDDMVKIVQNLVKNGLPRFIADKVIEKMPDDAIPHHSFNVIFIGVGQLTGSVATTPENMDNCRISSGKVISIDENSRKVKVKSDELIIKEGIIKLIPIEKEIDYSFVKPVIGDVLGIHWNRAVMKLDKRQETNLSIYTQKVIDIVNSANLKR